MTDHPKDREQRPSVSRLIEEAIEQASDAELEEALGEFGTSVDKVSEAGELWIANALIQAGVQRREHLRQKMLERSSLARRSTELSREEMIRLYAAYAANDDGNGVVTLAARNEAGEMSDEELASLIDDILTLQNIHT